MTEPSKFVFGVDLDGVCANFYEDIRPLAAEWLNKNERRLTKDVSYELNEWGFRNKEDYEDFHRWAVTQRDLFKVMTPIKGCPQALRRLSKSTVRIRIITHRLFIRYFHLPAINQTVHWLDRHGIPYWDLCFMGEKDRVGAHVYIEDAPSNIHRLLDEGLKVIIFANSTNREFEGNPNRVKTWPEAETLVKRHFKEWEATVDGASRPRRPVMRKQ